MFSEFTLSVATVVWLPGWVSYVTHVEDDFIVLYSQTQLKTSDIEGTPVCIRSPKLSNI